MNITLKARLRAYTRVKDLSDTLPFMVNLPEEDGNYILSVSIVNGEKTFSWVKQMVIDSSSYSEEENV